MSPSKINLLEIRNEYVDTLERWIEIYVFDQEDVAQMVSTIDLENMELAEYKNMLVSQWPGIPVDVKQNMSQAATDEIYTMILAANPSLHPRFVSQIEEFGDPNEAAVKEWFASGGHAGNKPVILEREDA